MTIGRAMGDVHLARVRKDGSIQTVGEHLLAVGRLSAKFSEKIGMPRAGELMGLLHDLGKYSKAFQDYLRSETGFQDPDRDDTTETETPSPSLRGKVDHSTAGAQWAWNALEALPGEAGRFVRHAVALAVASHHTGMMDCLSPNGENLWSRRMEKPEDSAHASEAAGLLDEAVRARIGSLVGPSLVEEVEKALAPLGSKPAPIKQFHEGLVARFLFSALIDADRLDSSELWTQRIRPNDGYPDWKVLVDRLDARLRAFKRRNEIDDLRSIVSDRCLTYSRGPRGLYRFSAPTGIGKTLSSLRYALNHADKHGLDRVFYVIPYTSIIDQNARDVRAILERPEDGVTVVLEHHSNLTPEKHTAMGSLLSENWDAPVVFTTMVQFMEAFFGSGTRGVRRLHRLARSVIIFDEVQALPVKTVHLFNNALNFLVETCGSTVLLCTATQPTLHDVNQDRGALPPSPEITDGLEDRFRVLNRVRIVDGTKKGGWTCEEVADRAVREMKACGSVLVVVNTKASAKALYGACQERAGGSVVHLSTNMCPAHRRAVIDRLRSDLDLENGKPVICVSTQLIEAGVDLDFGFVIRYRAGLDSVAQAAGRCNRHGLRALGTVLVVNPADENLDRLHEIRKGANITARILDEYKKSPDRYDDNLIGDRAIRSFYKYYFHSRADIMDYPIGKECIGRTGNLLDLLSVNGVALLDCLRINRKAPEHLRFLQSFGSAARAFKTLDADTEGIVVPYEDGERIVHDLLGTDDLRERRGLLRAAQQYSVSVRPWLLDEMREKNHVEEAGVGSGIWYLKNRYCYDEYLGLDPLDIFVIS